MLTVNEHVAHSEIDPYGVVLAVDPVSDFVEQSADGRLLQGHGGRQATANQSGPHLPDAVPVPRTGHTNTTVQTQQAVQSALKPTHTGADYTVYGGINIYSTEKFTVKCCG